MEKDDEREKRTRLQQLKPHPINLFLHSSKFSILRKMKWWRETILRYDVNGLWIEILGIGQLIAGMTFPLKRESLEPTN